MRRYLPLILLFRDKTINLEGEDVYKVPCVYICKKRSLNFINASKHSTFKLLVGGKMTLKGNMRVARIGERLEDLVPMEHTRIKVEENSEEATCGCECHFIDTKSCKCTCK